MDNRRRLELDRASPTFACAAMCLVLAGCARPNPTSGAPTASASAVAGATSSKPPEVVAASARAPSSAAPTASAASGSPDLPQRDGDMLLVPAGEFVMGTDEGGERDEQPAHTVTTGAFYLDETEVTNGAWQKCVDAGRCRPPSPRNADLNHVGPDKRFRGPRQPISSISWDDARGYCTFVGKRLPTEAEWERAARGNDGRRYPWGNDAPSPERATFKTSVTSDVATHPTGAGPFGHLDLAGNVWEWVEDVYDPYAYKRSGAAKGIGGDCKEAMAAQEELRRKKLDGFTGSNPIPTECERVLRGGAFNYGGEGLRSSNRVHHPARYQLVMSGFRCARDARP